MAQKHTIDCKEYPMTRDGRIQGPSRRYRRLRHPTFPATEWTAKNPLLQRGEIGAESDTKKIKVGDGLTYWNDLPYVTSVGQPLSTANYQMGNSSGEWTTMTQAQQDALNSGATATNIGEIAGKVNIDGSSTMTGPLKMRATSSFQCAIAPFWDGVGFYKLNSDDSVTLIASIETPDGFIPWVTNTYNIGSSLKKWKNLYLAGKAFVSTINNGADITVPATSGTMALTSDLPSVMTGATAGDAGTSGLVPAPTAGDQGKFLQGDGTWATVDALPLQTGHSGEYLTTDGSSASWAAVNTLPDQTGQAGKFLTTDGTDASWSDKPLVNSSTKTNALAIGSNSAAGNYTTSIGSAAYSSLSTYGLCAGYNSASTGAGSVALGAGSHASALHSIQISSAGSTSAYNNDADTFKVANANGNYEMMSADGTIPEARLADTTSATAGQVLTLDSNLDAEWKTISTMTGADGVNAGTSGLVPAPSATDNNNFLRGDGTWVDIDYVVEKQDPNVGNNYTWYRKYKSGWVEQGGIASTNGGNPTPITLPVEMVDANYVPFIQGKTAADGYSGATWQVMPVDTATSRQTSTQFYAQGSITGYNLGFSWRVEGMAA